MNSFLSKILNYESQIFENYLSKRKDFLQHLKTIKTNELSKEESLIFINNLKDIIDPIKSTTKSIDDFLENTYSCCNDELINYLFLGYFVSLLSEEPDSKELRLEHESESDVSESV